MKTYSLLLSILSLSCSWVTAGDTKVDDIPTRQAEDGTLVFAVRDIPAGVPKKGHGKDAKKYGYRIPSLLTTSKGSVLAFSERRLGLHDHAQNDIVLKRSTDGGKTWGKEIVAVEDGMNSINDPLTVQLSDGRIMMMYARFPYGRHARASGWIQMAEPGYDDLKLNILTYITFSDDDGLTWSEPRDISRAVKQPHWLNANTPGAMIQLKKGKHKGRILASLWGAVPVKDKDGKVTRNWEIVVAYSDDNAKTWKRTESLKDPEKGFPNECQIAEASNGDLVIVSRNQAGAKMRKKSISKDSGMTWSVIKTDPTLASAQCMGSVISGPEKPDGSWDLYASHPAPQSRVDGRISISTDHGKSFQIKKIIKGYFGYSVMQISPDGKNLLCLYETKKVREIRFLSISLDQLK
ncbi:exo-alpha-sialidase [Verrucomicrobiaceae bacterium N1E253]|uniref:exo-alpha-sialidase n=1 Tax=Oceaniferula marina TaxID=2748318 RepID=A0A851G9P2_9BACT|nr:sialidase family protein [Oceaniferula marina]NWK54136.1 exo-alpha-sialidase [Oceaniferula marina]